MNREKTYDVLVNIAKEPLDEIRELYVTDALILANQFYDSFETDIPALDENLTDSEKTELRSKASRYFGKGTRLINNKDIYIFLAYEYFMGKFYVTEGFVKYTVKDNIPVTICTIIKVPDDESSYLDSFQSPSFKTSDQYEIVLRSSLFSLYDAIQVFVKLARISVLAEKIFELHPNFGRSTSLVRPRDNKGIDVPLDELKSYGEEFIKKMNISNRVRGFVGPHYRWEDDLQLHNYHFQAMVRV